MQATAGTVCALNPTHLWRHFWHLTQIPRPSGYEGKVSQYVKDLAAKKNLKWVEDATGNLVVKMPGSGEYMDSASVMIQGHLDMVCEKNSSVQHDFFNDPLKLTIDGEWMQAIGTTLGADNGIGVAAALALMEEQPGDCPPLELLFTVDEETGLTGAKTLDSKALGLSSGTLLNLDTEVWGEVCIGCAGGGDAKLSLKVEYEDCPPGFEFHELKVTGLLGGHSGIDIDQYRGNAVKWMTIVIHDILKAVPSARIVQVGGGDKRNALAREAQAIVALPSNMLSDAKKSVSKTFSVLKEEYSRKENNANLALEPSPGIQGPCLSPKSQQKLLSLLMALPHGPQKYSHTMPGLVETSCNVASVKCDKETSTYRIQTSSRSSIGGALERLRDQIKTIGDLCGATTATDEAYPGWNPDPNSSATNIVQSCFKELHGSDSKLVALHAGLECGILREQISGIDAVSYGPTITGAHSPDEKVHIPSVDLFWQLTLRVLQKLGDQNQKN